MDAEGNGCVEFYDTARRLIYEVIKAMEDSAKLNEGQRKTGCGLPLGLQDDRGGKPVQMRKCGDEDKENRNCFNRRGSRIISAQSKNIRKALRKNTQGRSAEGFSLGNLRFTMSYRLSSRILGSCPAYF